MLDFDKIDEIIAEINSALTHENSPGLLLSNFFDNTKKDLKDVITNQLLDVLSSYETALEDLATFMKLLLVYLVNCKKHFLLLNKISAINDIIRQNFNSINENKILKAKISSEIKKLNKIKDDLIESQGLTKNTDLFNLINEANLGNPLDVQKFIKNSSLSELNKNSFSNNIEKIALRQSSDKEKIENLISSLLFYKRFLSFQKDEIYRMNLILNEKKSDLEKKDQNIWPKKMDEGTNEALVEINEFVNNLDEVSLSLIVSFCGQLNCFEVLKFDPITKEEEVFKIDKLNEVTYRIYIERWFRSFNYYLNHIRGA